MRIVYASFDEVPSFKAASTHILANCRPALSRHRLELITLGDIALPAQAGFLHVPAALREKNYLRRGLAFRDFVRRRLVRERPQVFHFRTPWEGLLAGELKLPNVYEVNGLPSIELPYLYRNAGSRALAVLRDWEQACLSRADAIVCPSERIRECLLRRYHIPEPGRIRVIPNGYDPVPVPTEKHPLLPGEGALRAIYLGTLHPWQGILWSLRAFVHLEERYTLDIYGVGARQWRHHAEKRIARYGLQDRVRLHPPVERGRFADVLADYDLGLAPLLKTERNAEQGCCPVKIMDYFAHGLPTVAADLAVVRPLVTHGDNGLPHPPGCLTGLVAALAEFHERRAELPEWRRRVRASLTRFPTWDECGTRMMDIYEDIARARRCV
ncbi:glycosyltransferase family 4 protein [Methylomagnum sp.]